jgi:hypothetical protein
MPSTLTPAAQPEPTLRDVLHAVHGLGTRMDRFEVRMDGLETRIGGLEDRMVSVENGIRGLTVFVGEQFAHTTREIAKLRAAHEAHDVRFEHIEGRLDEVIRLGEDNRRIGLKNQEDIARIDRRLDAHLADHEIHLPRPRSADVPGIGPMAA